MRGYVRPWNADEDGLAPDDHREIAWELEREDLRQRVKAIRAMWGNPIKSGPRSAKKGWTIYDGHERNRDDDWTFWRGVRATVGCLFNISPRLDPATGNWVRFWDSYSIAYWDSGPTYGGYTVERLNLHGWFGVELFNDGESFL